MSRECGNPRRPPRKPRSDKQLTGSDKTGAEESGSPPHWTINELAATFLEANFTRLGAEALSCRCPFYPGIFLSCP